MAGPTARKKIPLAEDLFCHFAHNLAQVKWMKCGNKKFSYCKSGGNQISNWGQVKERTWGDAEIPEIELRTKPKIKAGLPWDGEIPNQYGSALEELFRNTTQQRLEEQFEWLSEKHVKLKR